MELLNRLKRWHQKWPESLATYSFDAAAEHHCLNCGHDYAGDYCPCCGQKSSVGRISWKSMLASFLEVWDFNTRSIPSTMLQLVYRPGYMLKDYLQGRRQSYFPPIKLLFVVALVIAICGYWFGPDKQEKAEVTIEVTSSPEKAISAQAKPNEGTVRDGESAESAQDVGVQKKEEVDQKKMGKDIVDQASEWANSNRGWSALILCSLFILPTCLFFHWAPGYKKISIPECFFVSAYLSVIQLTCSFISDFTPLFEVWPIFFFYFANSQLFGYGWWGTFWRTTLVLILAGCTFIFIVSLVAAIYLAYELEMI